MTSEKAGELPQESMLVDVDALLAAYTDRPSGPVAFGTSGHRGSSLRGTFNEAHILAISRGGLPATAQRAGIDGPLFLGRRHPRAVGAGASRPRSRCSPRTASTCGSTPTTATRRRRPSRTRSSRTTAGGRRAAPTASCITPSHNPPEDGGFKYNPPNGGPADTDVTRLDRGPRRTGCSRPISRGVERIRLEARRAATTPARLRRRLRRRPRRRSIDMDAVRGARVKLGVDPLGGASVAYWPPIRERYGLDLTVVNDGVDPTFRFMPLDHDGKIRMDCSSPYAMAGPDRAAGPLRRRVRQRCRRRPPRDRHARARAC